MGRCDKAYTTVKCTSDPYIRNVAYMLGSDIALVAVAVSSMLYVPNLMYTALPLDGHTCASLSFGIL